eukprot:gene9915-20615_t
MSIRPADIANIECHTSQDVMTNSGIGNSSMTWQQLADIGLVNIVQLGNDDNVPQYFVNVPYVAIRICASIY